MAAPEPESSAPPRDAEALAAARAEFWARWRGELPSYAEARRIAARAVRDEAVPTAEPRKPQPSVRVVSRSGRTAASLRAWFDVRIAKELARCEHGMTANEWREHREWIEENARGSLMEALTRHAAKGAL
ncbi:hypothetical protein F6X37_34590 [Paraburkholderia sp. 31.1]|uniref:hypothetical protein n=1 Tax=Paraburkholderia sp. 31.1 TaxID=2615205 RepID=UPI0016558E47|nr:hypothetical protein [Paraburkholderia sp. 31.1]MBC8726467.1 hypothetical protein [Paraburkholderia sp. 31.1]